MAEKKKTENKSFNPNRPTAVIGTKGAKHLKEGRTYFVTEDQAKVLVEKKEAKIA